VSLFSKADSPLDRSRIVARSYREALRMNFPELCARIDEHMLGLGQTWVVPQIAQYELDDLLTAQQAADYCGIEKQTLQVWKSRGLTVIETVDGRRYRVADLLAYQAERRVRRKSRGSLQAIPE
jgi:hypothetical protein